MEEAIETVAALGFFADGYIARPALVRDYFDDIAEFHKEYTEFNLIDFLDGICDSIYVLVGGAVNADVDIQRHFDEVHAANMRKLDGPKRADGKQLKPEGWVGPDHERIMKVYLSVSQQEAYVPYYAKESQDGQCCRTAQPPDKPSGAG
jgi:hypothetical protein